MNNFFNKRYLLSLFTSLWLLALGCAGFRPPTASSDYTLSIDTIIAKGFNKPVGITNAGDASGRLFIVEQGGLIRIIQTGSVLPEPFLDIRQKVSGASEQGLLGLAFHPNYSQNGFFYIDYTDLQGNTNIVRYTVSKDPNMANPESGVVQFTIKQPYRNHNGGEIAFGPDGYLYIAMGDGGSANDPQGNAQNLSSPLGAILRIDVHDDGTYSSPDSNPFVQKTAADTRIWAWGLRNPWRFSFDRQTGDLYIADVGQNRWEEIDFQIAGSAGGLNYGWRCMEGSHLNFNEPPCSTSPDELVNPVAEYGHSEGESVSGGYVYRGSLYPQIQGAYFYADFESGRVWSLRLRDRELMSWSVPRIELNTRLNISTFGEDESGELYLADYSGGTIHHITAVPVTH